MNSELKNCKNQNISNSVDIDSICNKLLNSGIEYDEHNELLEFINIKIAGKSELIKTDERYSRYLRGISIWEIDGISYEYIRNNIKMYLNMKTTENNIITKLRMMRTIDNQIKEIIDKDL